MRSYHSLKHVSVLTYFCLVKHMPANILSLYIEKYVIYLSSQLLEMCILRSFENMHISIISITLYQLRYCSYSRVWVLDSDWMPKIVYLLIQLIPIYLFNSIIETFPFTHRFFNSSRKIFRNFFKTQRRKHIRLWCFYSSGKRSNLVVFWIFE